MKFKTQYCTKYNCISYLEFTKAYRKNSRTELITRVQKYIIFFNIRIHGGNILILHDNIETYVFFLIFSNYIV